MQQWHHVASSYYQLMMMQEFDAIAGVDKGTLPPGWIKMWDNPGGRHYYFNTLDHDIQYDMVRVLEKGALAAAAAKTEELSLNDELVLPDGGVSSSNNTISPSPLSTKGLEGTLAT
jgi:hypothetical protein